MLRKYVDWSSLLYKIATSDILKDSDHKPIKSPANPDVKLTLSGVDDHVCDQNIY